jgi:hypothetical protein
VIEVERDHVRVLEIGVVHLKEKKGQIEKLRDIFLFPSAAGESKVASESRAPGQGDLAATHLDDTARLVAIRPVTGRLQWKIFATFATVKAVAGTLLAFQPLGKMPADVYMRLTEVLRLKLSLLLHSLSDTK